MRYQDIYPSDPLIRSGDMVGRRARDLLSLEYFEAPPGSMPKQTFLEHHILVNLKETSQQVDHWVDGQHRDLTLGLNDIVVTPAGVESGWRWHEPSKVIIITLDPDELRQFAQQEVGLLLSDRQLRLGPPQENSDLVMAATMVLDALRQQSAGSDVMFESLARVFLVKLLDGYGEAQTEHTAFSRSYTADHHRRVLAVIEDQFADGLPVEQMADAAGLSLAHFSRAFKSVIGETPHRFVMGYRVEQAARMLKALERPMIEIALACGFSDQAHLTRVFKKIRGQTPKQWRAALQG